MIRSMRCPECLDEIEIEFDFYCSPPDKSVGVEEEVHFYVEEPVICQNCCKQIDVKVVEKFLQDKWEEIKHDLRYVD